MLIRFKKLATVAALCVCAMQTGGAQTPPPPAVAVRVELVFPRYRDRFANRDSVERRTAEQFAEYLKRNVGFLRFVANDTTIPYRLTFLLDRLDRNSVGSFPEIGFWARLDRPQATPVESYWLQFRTADQALTGVGTATAFLTEIRSRLQHQDADSLRRGFLSRVPIAETGLTNLNPLGVVLPYRLLDLCMKNESSLEFVAEIRGTITMELPFKAQIVGSFNPQGPLAPDIQAFSGGGFAKVMNPGQPDELTPSVAQKTATIKRIFVTSYVFDPTACDNRGPAAVGAVIP